MGCNASRNFVYLICFFALISATEQKSFSSVQLVNAPSGIFIAFFLKKLKKFIFYGIYRRKPDFLRLQPISLYVMISCGFPCEGFLFE